MKRAARAAGAALVLAILLTASRTRAQITYISQERLIKSGTYSVPRIPPADPGTMPFYTVNTVTAPDMAPFSTSLGQAMQISSFDQTGIRARGESGTLSPTGPIGNLYSHYLYGFSQTQVVFEVDEPTPFTSTAKFPNMLNRPVSLSGPAGERFDLSGFDPVSGVLSPGTWTFLAVADANRSSSEGYNLEVSFVPEPGAIAIAAGMFMVGVRRRRK